MIAGNFRAGYAIKKIALYGYMILKTE